MNIYGHFLIDEAWSGGATAVDCAPRVPRGPQGPTPRLMDQTGCGHPGGATGHHPRAEGTGGGLAVTKQLVDQWERVQAVGAEGIRFFFSSPCLAKGMSRTSTIPIPASKRGMDVVSGSAAETQSNVQVMSVSEFRWNSLDEGAGQGGVGSGGQAPLSRSKTAARPRSKAHDGWPGEVTLAVGGERQGAGAAPTHRR